MNSTTIRLRESAWSKIEALASMKRFIQSELEHSQSLLPSDSYEKLREALNQINRSNSEVFLLIEQPNQVSLTAGLEQKLEELSCQYDHLMQNMEGIFGE